MGTKTTRRPRRDAPTVQHRPGCPRKRPVRATAGEEESYQDSIERYPLDDPKGRTRQIARCVMCGAHAVDGRPAAEAPAPDEENDDGEEAS